MGKKGRFVDEQKKVLTLLAQVVNTRQLLDTYNVLYISEMIEEITDNAI